MLIQFIKKVIKEAGDLALLNFDEARVLYSKEDSSEIVTQVDLEVNDLLVKKITKQYPEHGILSEETGRQQRSSEYLWIIDPIDGTRNFATGTPIFAVMLGLAKNNKMAASAIYDPINDELVFAEKGKGAFKNDKPIRCANIEFFKHSFGCGSINYKASKKDLYQKFLNASAENPYWISGFGSTAISAIYVADGRRDWLVHTKASDWDYAIPSLILSEAGCKVTDSKGQSWQLGSKELVAANPELHKQLLDIISE